jgi:two-component system chemotaxis sensor kinase CheA
MLKTVKVSIDKLDLLLNNVGELVIANSGFYRLYEELRKYSNNKTLITEFKNRMEQMSRIAKDLQTGIMKTRMVPIGQVFSRFNRLVRDLAREHKKNVELIIKGEDTELDKKVIDVIGELCFILFAML